MDNLSTTTTKNVSQDTPGQGSGGGLAMDNLSTTTTKNVSQDTRGLGSGDSTAIYDEDTGEYKYDDEVKINQPSVGNSSRSNNDYVNNYSGTPGDSDEVVYDEVVSDEVVSDEGDPEFDDDEVMEEFGALDKPIYEGFTNSDFNASNLVRGRNLHNLLKALLISLVLCSLNHKDVSKMVVDPLVKLVHNKLSHSTMVCVLVFVVSYLVIAFL